MEQIDTRDEALLSFFSSDGDQTIVNYLDSVFGFLYRRTDFYKVKKHRDESVGFMPGEALRLVLKIFKQYQDLEEHSTRLSQLETFKSDGVAPQAVAEIEISGENDLPVGPVEKEPPKSSATKSGPDASDSYNGAVCEKFSWNQTLADVEISVPVPKDITRGKQVSVKTTNTTVKVSVGAETLLDGELTKKVKNEDTIWSLVPGKCVQLHLEKVEQRWWDALLTTDKKINVRLIDPSRPLQDFPEDEQMRVREMVANQEKRRTNSQKTEEMLKAAWNAEGSPFKDTPYDPTKVNF
ncbi:nudC domain-containing protein 3 [Neocloeon triangulifer]|uniref:nudC domain-containing protein 3 n=1 Tax=Neocloeon triangulifer TaxID=2078957 RepID=UPI00286F726C|nr:nudC domain-containing protein 3 [Neocloeon triangulifer]